MTNTTRNRSIRRRGPASALIASVLFALGSVNPAGAATFSPANDPSHAIEQTRTVRLSGDETRRAVEDTPIDQKFGIEDQYQGYWVRHVSDVLVLHCWYDDDTGELVFCDVYG